MSRLINSIAKPSFITSLMTLGVSIDFGVAAFKIKTDSSQVASNVYELYGGHNWVAEDAWNDFSVNVARPNNLRRYFYPQAIFKLEDQIPFLPLPLSQSYPLLEWGMNWCIANHFHQYLIFHAAVLERNGAAILFPAPPGSGKSTLCSYLAHSGWRLLSDEMAIIDLRTLQVIPFVRGICLKNDAIDIFKGWFPEAYITPTARNTNKGDVAHVRPPANAIKAMQMTAKVKAIVFPKYDRETECNKSKMDSVTCMRLMIENAFNYNVLGVKGFRTLADICDIATGYELTYSNINEAESFLRALVDAS